MSKKAIKSLSVLLFLGIIPAYLLIGSFVSSSSPPDLHLQQVRKMDFDVRLHTVGRLDTARSHRITSEIKGNKGKIIFLVDDGALVEKGDVLVRFDPTPFEADLLTFTGEVKSQAAVLEAMEQSLKWEKTQADRERKVAAYQLATARLELTQLVDGEIPLKTAQLEGELEDAEQDYIRHESFLEELEKLESRGISNPNEIDQARKKTAQLKRMFEIAKKKYVSYAKYVAPSKIESAKTRVYSGEMELEQIKKGGQIKVARAEAAVAKARRELETAEERMQQVQRELDKTTIRAPFAGIAVLFEGFIGNEKRRPRIGDTVWQNQPILYLPDVSSFIVKTKVREVDLHQVAKGQRAVVHMDAYPEVEFTGKVVYIGTLAEQARELGREKYFQLTIALEGNDALLRPGMTARATILCQHVKMALTVPIQSIFGEGREKHCYRYNGSGFEKVAVETAAQNEAFVQIVSGLKEGDRVSLIEPDGL